MSQQSNNCGIMPCIHFCVLHKRNSILLVSIKPSSLTTKEQHWQCLLSILLSYFQHSLEKTAAFSFFAHAGKTKSCDCDSLHTMPSERKGPIWLEFAVVEYFFSHDLTNKIVVEEEIFRANFLGSKFSNFETIRSTVLNIKFLGRLDSGKWHFLQAFRKFCSASLMVKNAKT